jgi:hypothetical protein
MITARPSHIQEAQGEAQDEAVRLFHESITAESQRDTGVSF